VENHCTRLAPSTPSIYSTISAHVTAAVLVRAGSRSGLVTWSETGHESTHYCGAPRLRSRTTRLLHVGGTLLSDVETGNLTMGWLKPTSLAFRREKPADLEQTRESHSHVDKDNEYLKHDDTTAQHLEVIGVRDTTNTTQHVLYPVQPINLENSSLPFIPSTIVRSALKGLERTWIVVDNIVYDCTDFALEHPGGETVIHSFAGQDCSWQFWRFHNLNHMKTSGRPLRVGRTTGVQNRFAERPRFVGLQRRDEW
jgi:cytochrome b involved in lipid metabolism